MDIQVVNRKNGSLFQEKVYGAKWIALFYKNPLLRLLIKNYFIQKVVSKVYGFLQKLSCSKSKVAPFIENFQIPMEKFIIPSDGFRSFDDFFVRALKEDFSKFPSEGASLGSPCEARLSVFKVHKAMAPLVVKGSRLSLKELVGSGIDLTLFEGGFVWVFRLCPVDYHRFHFPDSGVVSFFKPMVGKLHSVNPISLEKIPKVFIVNERNLSLLKTKNFGDLIYLEVGAVCVGEIEQFKRRGEHFERGEQKGMFHFGGSTVIMITKPDLQPSFDLIENTEKGFETLVGVGEEIAKKTI